MRLPRVSSSLSVSAVPPKEFMEVPKPVVLMPEFTIGTGCNFELIKERNAQDRSQERYQIEALLSFPEESERGYSSHTNG